MEHTTTQTRRESERQQRTTAEEHERPYSDLSPQEAHDKTEETVSRWIATAAGVVEGFADTMKKNDVPQKMKEAVQKLGEATRKVGKTTKEEYQKTKQEVTGQASEGPDTETPKTGRAPERAARTEPRSSRTPTAHDEDLERLSSRTEY